MWRIYTVDLSCFAVFLVLWLIMFFVQARMFWCFLIVLFFYLTVIIVYVLEDLPEKIKPLKYTYRVVRATLIVSLLQTVLSVVMVYALDRFDYDEYFVYFSFVVLLLLYPLTFILSMSVLNVFERLNHRRYHRRTKKQLKEFDNLIKIAITGSFAKTSVKNFLCTFLSTRYNTVMAPLNFNTPLGIAKWVGNINCETEVAIFEFGARRVGDIDLLMDIVSPTHSILTSVGTQHLETFKSEKKIFAEKVKVLQIAQSVCTNNAEYVDCDENHYDGFSIVADNLHQDINSYFASDSDRQNSWLKSRQGRQNGSEILSNIVYAGFDESSDFVIGDISICQEGCTFSMTVKGEKHFAHTKLLGRHNLLNIALASSMAYGLGVEMDDIVSAIATLEPVEHRLQLLCAGGINILDDTYNSNPIASVSALEVLSLFGGRKVVMTPGLVELGAIEEDENILLGKRIAEVADIAIIIGNTKYAKYVVEGLKQENFGGQIFKIPSVAQAQLEFENILKSGDTMLMLNDLPDIFLDNG